MKIEFKMDNGIVYKENDKVKCEPEDDEDEAHPLCMITESPYPSGLDPIDCDQCEKS